jgi:hypothetical protein
MAADPNAASCPNCGGTHFGSYECPFTSSPCVICGQPTVYACSDCAIESGGQASVHVCNRTPCLDEHERLNPQHPKMETLNAV